MVDDNPPRTDNVGRTNLKDGDYSGDQGFRESSFTFNATITQRLSLIKGLTIRFYQQNLVAERRVDDA